MRDERMLPWPPLPDRVSTQLELIRAEDDDAEAEGAVQPDPDADPHTGEIMDRRIRPWELARLDGDLEVAVFTWLDDVVMWLNEAYGWQEEQVIPACWPLHAGLAHDLAAVAFGRLDAYDTTTPAYVGRWHSDLEDFYRRMSHALGIQGGQDCRRGEHKRPAKYAVDGVRNTINKGRRKAEK